MPKVAHIPRSALALSKLCSKDKKDLQRSSIHLDKDAVVSTNGVVLLAAQIHKGGDENVSIAATDIIKMLSHSSADNLHVTRLDDVEVQVSGADIRGVLDTTLRSQRTSVEGWRDEFKGLTSICQLCLSIDDMIVLLQVIKAAASLKGSLSGTGFGVFIDVCKKDDQQYLVVRLRNVKHNNALIGIIQSLNVGDRWLEISDWEQEILQWPKP